jgi:endonuclease/exonuclease/phosphatase family metal-dependent hydrolase
MKPINLLRPVLAALAAFACAAACAVALATPASARPAFGPVLGDTVRLRVMTYNIHAGAGADERFDLERTARAIEAERPDVVALQEVDVEWSARSEYVDESAWLARRLRMRAYFAPIYTLAPDRPGAAPRRYGLAILSRHPILAATNHSITRLSTQVPNPVPEPAPGFPEVLIQARGARLWLYNTHLDFRTDPAVRRMQVADMQAIMARRPGRQLLLGDFNAVPEAAELAPLWSRFQDAMAAVGTPQAPTFPAAAPVRRIDYVTATVGVRVAAARVPATLASDHLPVVADIELRAGH